MGIRRISAIGVVGFLGLVLLCVLVVPAAALGELDDRSPIEYAIGLRYDQLWLARSGLVGAGRVSVDVGERWLYGVPGLAITRASASLRMDRNALSARLVRLSSAVGSETTATVQASFRARHGPAFSMSASAHIASVTGTAVASLFTADVDVAIPVSSGLAIGCSARDVRLGGLALDGVNTETFAMVSAKNGSAIVGRLHVRRDGLVGFAVSFTFAIRESLRAALGFDEADESIDAAIGLEARSVVFELGGTHHPVLGVTKAVVVGCRF